MYAKVEDDENDTDDDDVIDHRMNRSMSIHSTNLNVPEKYFPFE